MRPVQVLRFPDPQPYGMISKLQGELVRKIIDGRQGKENLDYLLLLEHEPVITLGRRSHSEQGLENSTIPVHKSNRGGQITYHGPGQFVAYPILDLLRYQQSLQWYTETLASVMKDTIKITYGLETFYQSCPSRVGLWLSQSEKVGFIGIQGQRWVVSHGCSVNLKKKACSGFKEIIPCGLGEDVKIASCEDKSRLVVPRLDFEAAFIETFKNRFLCKIVH